MKKFTYVFSKEDKERLLKAGYLLLKSDDRNGVYVFKASDELSFVLNEIEDFMESDRLTF